MKKKKTKSVAKKGRQLSAKQTKKIRGGVGRATLERSRTADTHVLDFGDAEGMRGWAPPAGGR